MRRSTSLPIHPVTGFTALGIIGGRPVWPVCGGSEDGGEGEGGAPPPKTFVPPASQEELDRLINKATGKVHGRYPDYDLLKEKAAKHDALEMELGSAADKAAAKAREDERAKQNEQWIPRVVKAEFKAAAKGVLTEEQVTDLLEDIDLSKFVTATGDVDEEKIAKKIAVHAPKNDTPPKHQTRDLGQGNRQGVQAKPGDAGRAMAEKRFGKKSA